MADDVQLLQDYSRRGDVSSLSALVARHGVWLTAFLRGLLPERADADDAFQDVWMRVIRTAENYRGGNVRSYLARIARSVAIDRLRTRARTVSLDAEDADGVPSAETLPATAPGTRERVEIKASAEEVRAALRELQEGPRQVLLLRIEAEMSFREIAAELSVPLGTALTWMRAATEHLKRKLGEQA